LAALHHFLLCGSSEDERQSQKQQGAAIVPDVPSWMNGTSHGPHHPLLE
jgi:hypothetical protein